MASLDRIPAPAPAGVNRRIIGPPPAPPTIAQSIAGSSYYRRTPEEEQALAATVRQAPAAAPGTAPRDIQHAPAPGPARGVRQQLAELSRGGDAGNGLYGAGSAVGNAYAQDVNINPSAAGRDYASLGGSLIRQQAADGGARAVPGTGYIPGALGGTTPPGAPPAPPSARIGGALTSGQLSGLRTGAAPSAGGSGGAAFIPAGPAYQSSAQQALPGLSSGGNALPGFTSAQHALPSFGGGQGAVPGVRDGQAQSTGVLGAEQAAMRQQLQGVGQQAASGQASLAALQMAASTGNGPTAATGALLQGSRNNINNMAAIAANSRGGNAAAAVRNAAVEGKDAALQSQAQIGQLRANEMIAAREQLRGVLSDTRGQDIDTGRLQNDALNTARGQDIDAANVTNNANVAFRGQDVNRENNVLTNNLGNRNASIGEYNAVSANNLGNRNADVNQFNAVSADNLGNRTADTNQYNAVSANNLGNRQQDTASFAARSNDYIDKGKLAVDQGQLGVNAYNATADAGLRSRALDDARAQNAIANSLGLANNSIDWENMDNQTRIQLADYYARLQETNNNYKLKQASNSNDARSNELAERQQNIDVVYKTAKAVGEAGAALKD